MNEIPEIKQTAAFPSIFGSKTLVTPDKPKDKTLVICTTLLKIISSTPLVIAERFRFWKHDQMEVENVRQYIADLKKLTKNCSFGTFLDEAHSGISSCVD